METKTNKQNNNTNIALKSAVKLSRGLGAFLKEKHRQIPPLGKDNKSTPEKDFFVTSALFYWYMEETVKWLKLAEKSFEHLLEQSKSPYLKEFYESILIKILQFFSL